MLRAIGAAVLAVLLLAPVPASAHEYQVRRGRPATTEDWSFVVQLRFRETSCTGMLIAPGWVLSAAHCGGEETAVRVLGPGDGGKEPSWQAPGLVIRHPAWDPAGEAHDLALIRLAAGHRYAGRPVRLADAADAHLWDAGRPIRFAGWGRTDDEKHPTQLHEGEAVVAAASSCRTNPTDLCLAGGASSPCFGDSGGPMLAGDVIVAVSVRTMRDCHDRSFGALVAADRAWIQEVLAGAEVRVAGGDRYETAAAVARSWRRAGTVFVAGGEAGLDAVAAGPMAALAEAPVLLTPSTTLHPAAASALRRLRPASIVVVGGTASVDDAVVEALRAIAPTERRAGPDRYATAAALAADHQGPADVVYLSPPDLRAAITVASVAAWTGAPLLFVDPAGPLHPGVGATLAQLQPREIVLAADRRAIGQHLLRDLEEIGQVRLVDAPDPDARTQELLARLPARPSAVAIASSAAVPDALSGIAANRTHPATLLLLADPGCLPPPLHDLVQRSTVLLLGGNQVLPTGTRGWTSC